MANPGDTPNAREYAVLGEQADAGKYAVLAKTNTETDAGEYTVLAEADTKADAGEHALLAETDPGEHAERK